MENRVDVLIVGSGVAGLYAALNLPDDMNILLICKRELALSNSSLAQGGVAAVLDKINDNFELHINDTLISGGYKNNEAAVRVLVEEGPADVMRVINMGADFDKAEDGSYQLTLEGGHSRRRIVHHKDSTGEEMTRALIEQVKQRKNITIIENTMLSQLQKADNGFIAELIAPDELFTISASYVILGTGGIGRVYKYTTNSAIATGDGIRIAYELGAKIAHLDRIQFHPTAFASSEGRERFLISEAVRGEGAYLLNCFSERFMHRYDERKELAPRDVVSHSIMMEYRRTGSDKFYLDITHRDSDYLIDRFPMIYKHCLHQGVDITTQKIPIFPCQHYLMGGIDVDLRARTTIDRLYAVGECSHTGVHGGNRLASNSLLEALVFSRRAAEDITARRTVNESPVTAPLIKPTSGTAPLPDGMRTQIREIMQKAHFVLPDAGAAEKGLRTIEQMLSRLDSNIFSKTQDYCEAKSLCTTAFLILKEASK